MTIRSQTGESPRGHWHLDSQSERGLQVEIALQPTCNPGTLKKREIT